MLSGVSLLCGSMGIRVDHRSWATGSRWGAQIFAFGEGEGLRGLESATPETWMP